MKLQKFEGLQTYQICADIGIAEVYRIIAKKVFRNNLNKVVKNELKSKKRILYRFSLPHLQQK